MIEYSYWIVLLPLVAAFGIFFFGRWLPLKGASLGILSILTGLFLSLNLFWKLLQHPGVIADLSIPWFRFGMYQMELSFYVDGLAALMLVVVTLVSSMVHIYSTSYMHDDPRFKRYYAYLSLFTFAMLILVVANNFLQMFIGWEIMGAASYLLIGFWFEKTSAANAARKAFITTKVGDLGFFIGLMSLFALLGTLNFNQLQQRIAEGLLSPSACAFIGLCLFTGAMGKSAQFPLHIWLPDAMEGPTPVSALIHAATMVAAGIYMIARAYFIFEHGPLSLEAIAIIGAITAFTAASMALVTTDIKRVLAFSTISQLGYMTLALGAGAHSEGRVAAIFHLGTHAFFKALLFLGAGSVIHAVHTNDIRQMGGLSGKMKGTFITFTFAWLAICGIWPFAGFFSKDAILESVYLGGHPTLFWIGVFVAFMTAFYMTRLYLLVFTGAPRDQKIYDHAHESPLAIVLPMALLAALALASGYLFHGVWNIHHWLEPVAENLETVAAQAEPAVHSLPHWFFPAVGSAAGISGIFLAFLIYVKRVVAPEKIVETFRPLHTLLERRYYLDDLFIHIFIQPADKLAAALYYFDHKIYDRFLVDGAAHTVFIFGQVYSWFDKYIVDGCVNFCGWLAQGLGRLVRLLQSGAVQAYLLITTLGLAMLLMSRLNLTLRTLFLRLF